MSSSISFIASLQPDKNLAIAFSEPVMNVKGQKLDFTDFRIKIEGGFAKLGPEINFSAISNSFYTVRFEIDGPVEGREFLNIDIKPGKVFDVSGGAVNSQAKQLLINPNSPVGINSIGDEQVLESEFDSSRPLSNDREQARVEEWEMIQIELKKIKDLEILADQEPPEIGESKVRLDPKTQMLYEEKPEPPIEPEPGLNVRKVIRKLNPEIKIYWAGLNNSKINELNNFFDMDEIQTQFKIQYSKDYKWESVLGADILLVYFNYTDPINNAVKKVNQLKKRMPECRVLCLVQDKVKEKSMDVLNKINADDFATLPINYIQVSQFIGVHKSIVSYNSNRSSEKGDKETKNLLFGKLLSKNGVIKPNLLTKVFDYQKVLKQTLGEVMVSLGYIDENVRCRFPKEHRGDVYVESDKIAAAVLEDVARIPYKMAKEHQCLALFSENGKLMVAMVDVSDLYLIDRLKDITDMDIKPVMGKLEDLKIAIQRFYKSISYSQAQYVPDELMATTDVRYLVEEPLNIQEDESYSFDEASNTNEVVSLMDAIISSAIEDGATEIHLEPYATEFSVRFRILNVLYKRMTPPKRLYLPLSHRIKKIGKLFHEGKVQNNGQFVLWNNGKRFFVRVSMIPSITGEKIMLKLFSSEILEEPFSNLGASSKLEKSLEKILDSNEGLILFNGPKCSGLTTSMYRLIKSIPDGNKNIVSIEEPVNCQLDGILQIKVDQDNGWSYDSAVHSLLQQNLDVALIDQLKNRTVTEDACRLAMSGALVITSIQSQDSLSALEQIISQKVNPTVFFSALKLVISQRLVKTNCLHCMEEYSPDEKIIEEMGLEKNKNQKFYKGKGCFHCLGTGFIGVRGVYDFVQMTHELKEKFSGVRLPNELLETSKDGDFQNLKKACVDLALAGETTLEHVMTHFLIPN